MTAIKAIQTRYDGCHFRSRLEARWAVFFNSLGVKWEYEKEGYELLSGKYLPDFWLPELGCWLEIKGTEPTEVEKRLCEELAFATNTPVFIAWGLPHDAKSANEYDRLIGFIAVSELLSCENHNRAFNIPRWWHYAWCMGGNGSLRFASDFTDNVQPDVHRVFYNPRSDGIYWREFKGIIGRDKGTRLPHSAFISASSARFEHGQQG
jgi:hypothetical protein